MPIAGQILVVDDNASNRDLLARQSTRAGHTVDGRRPAPTALALLQAAPSTSSCST